MKYLSANSYYQKIFGTKTYRVSLSLATTCPNRDGTLSNTGCIFCSAGGSGEFAGTGTLSITEQFKSGVEKLSRKTTPDTLYIAYFQSFTGTYVDPQKLKAALDETCSLDKVCAVSIGTRPDCLGDDIMEVLKSCTLPLFVELGLQTASDETATLINRCYKTEEYVEAAGKLKDANINVITHIIFGLPGETPEDMMNTVKLAGIGDGVKFTCLYVLKGTPLEQMWRGGQFKTLEMDEYFDIVEKALEILPEGMVVHRLTGDGPKSLLLSPMWSADKRKVINYINRRFG